MQRWFSWCLFFYSQKSRATLSPAASRRKTFARVLPALITRLTDANRRLFRPIGAGKPLHLPLPAPSARLRARDCVCGPGSVRARVLLFQKRTRRESLVACVGSES